jgi:hypothetical protein
MDTASEDERDESEHEQHGEHDANFGPGADNDDPDADEDTLFRETVGFSVLESYINAVTELWREQRQDPDHRNPHSVLRSKELTDLKTGPTDGGRFPNRSVLSLQLQLASLTLNCNEFFGN